jgi:hypothetical protein
MRIIARRTNAAADRGNARSRGRGRRLWLIQASVRSTIQRLGSTTKRCSSLRWTIVSYQVLVLAMAAAVFCPWYPASASITDEGEEAACTPIEDEQSAVAVLHSGRVDDGR